MCRSCTSWETMPVGLLQFSVDAGLRCVCGSPMRVCRPAGMPGAIAEDDMEVLKAAGLADGVSVRIATVEVYKQRRLVDQAIERSAFLSLRVCVVLW